MDELHLKKQPQLSYFQEYIRDMKKARGFDKNTIFQQMLLFQEEVGELAKAIRKAEALDVESSKEEGYGELKDELADVFMYLLDVSNRYDIDLEQAFRDKEEHNKSRTWSS